MGNIPLPDFIRHGSLVVGLRWQEYAVSHTGKKSNKKEFNEYCEHLQMTDQLPTLLGRVEESMEAVNIGDG